MSSATGNGDAAARYRIGAVAEITGVPPETLRAWERRYGSVDPDRAESGFRLYSEEDVERILLMKRLSERGNSIGSIARLTRDELRSRLARCEGGRRLLAASLSWSGHPVPVVTLDPGLAAELWEAGEAAGLRMKGGADSLDDLLPVLEGAGPAVLVAALSLLGVRPVEAVEELLGRTDVLGVVVVWEFARRPTLRRLALAGATLLEGRPTLDRVERAVREAPFSRAVARPLGLHLGPALPDGDEPNPGPRFSGEALGRLRTVDGGVDCECPAHLSSLVRSLLDFEAYCRRCEDAARRDGGGGEAAEEEAAVHRRLYRETGAARMILERALAFLCQAGGMPT